MRPFPELECERILLRPMIAADAADVFAVGGDDEVMRTYDMDTFCDLSAARAFIELQRDRFEAGLGTRWGIGLRSCGQVIGWCGFTPGAHRRAEVGYALARCQWGRGFATEALRAVVAFAFETTDLNRLEAVTHPPNLASARVLEKCGFRPEGLIRHYGFWRGEYHDMVLHGLLRSDL